MWLYVVQGWNGIIVLIGQLAPVWLLSRGVIRGVYKSSHTRWRMKNPPLAMSSTQNLSATKSLGVTPSSSTLSSSMNSSESTINLIPKVYSSQVQLCHITDIIISRITFRRTYYPRKTLRHHSACYQAPLALVVSQHRPKFPKLRRISKKRRMTPKRILAEVIGR